MKRRLRFFHGPPRRREPTSAGLLIAETLAQHGLTEAVRTHRVIAEWEFLVGDRIAKRSTPQGLTGRVLQVQVASSTWMHELALLKPQLLDVLWKALGEPRLFDDIAFHLAGRSRPARDAPGVAPTARALRARPSLPPPAASGRDQDRILNETATIVDDDLRDLISRIRTRHNR